MTDERMGTALLPSVRALPKGSGIVFRHYHVLRDERRALFLAVRRIARANRHLLLLAGTGRPAEWGADGFHGRPGIRGQSRGVMSVPVHNVRERIAAERAGADLLFVSPVYVTRSHPVTAGLGHARFGALIRDCKTPVIALGGLNAKRAKSLRIFGIKGWAAIDALTLHKVTRQS